MDPTCTDAWPSGGQEATSCTMLLMMRMKVRQSRIKHLLSALTYEGAYWSLRAYFITKRRQKFKDAKCDWPHPLGCTSDVQLHHHGMVISATGGERRAYTATACLTE